ncbi:MAG: putative RNA methyltransferase [Arachnia sp.]
MTALAHVATWLRCPVCHDGLELADSALVCSRQHSFDVARQGYVNLLRRAAPRNADTTSMVGARARFLAGGHYQPITEAVSAAVVGAHKILEVGAGTGHHLARVLDQTPGAAGVATDVSVHSCRRAAKAHPRLASLVADTWDSLPLRDAAVDAVLCIFAPRNFAEITRVLTDDGVVVIVIPRPEHLRQLREMHGLIDIGEDKLERLVQATSSSLSLTRREKVEFDLALTAEDATDLVGMGPNAFHETASIPGSDVHVSVDCLTFTAVGPKRH